MDLLCHHVVSHNIYIISLFQWIYEHWLEAELLHVLWNVRVSCEQQARWRSAGRHRQRTVAGALFPCEHEEFNTFKVANLSGTI